MHRHDEINLHQRYIQGSCQIAAVEHSEGRKGGRFRSEVRILVQGRIQFSNEEEARYWSTDLKGSWSSAMAAVLHDHLRATANWNGHRISDPSTFQMPCSPEMGSGRERVVGASVRLVIPAERKKDLVALSDIAQVLHLSDPTFPSTFELRVCAQLEKMDAAYFEQRRIRALAQVALDLIDKSGREGERRTHFAARLADLQREAREAGRQSFADWCQRPTVTIAEGAEVELSTADLAVVRAMVDGRDLGASVGLPSMLSAEELIRGYRALEAAEPKTPAT